MFYYNIGVLQEKNPLEKGKKTKKPSKHTLFFPV